MRPPQPSDHLTQSRRTFLPPCLTGLTGPLRLHGRKPRPCRSLCTRAGARPFSTRPHRPSPSPERSPLSCTIHRPHSLSPGPGQAARPSHACHPHMHLCPVPAISGFSGRARLSPPHAHARGSAKCPRRPGSTLHRLAGPHCFPSTFTRVPAPSFKNKIAGVAFTF